MQKLKEWGGVMALCLMMAMFFMGVTTPGPFVNDSGGVSAPGTGVFAPTQHDTNELTTDARAFIAEIAGDIKFKAYDATTITMTVTAGQQVNVRHVQIFDTGTTLADSDIVCIK